MANDAMAADSLPTGVAHLIRQHIESVLQLEILLLLHGTGAAWTLSEIAGELRVDEPAILRWLDDLVRRGLVMASGGPGAAYQLNPRSDVVAVRALADAYRERRVAVISAIFERPSDAVRSFADAFRLRKEPDHD